MGDERELVALIATGDEAAFQALYAAYYTRIWRYVWYQLDGQPGVVEDVLQDIFFAVWRAAARFRGDAKVSTWIFQIAHHVVSSARHKHRHDEYASTLPEEADGGADDAETHNGSFEDAAVDRLLLVDAIDRLSAKHQAVIYLIFVQGFSLEETAHILGVPHNTVKSRILAARRALHRQLHVAGLKEGDDADG